MLQIALAVWGIYVLVTGKLKVSQNKVVLGGAARLLGLLMLAPLPIGFMIGLGVGIWAGANGKPIEDIQIYLLMADVGLGLTTAVLVVAIAHLIGKPPVQPGMPPAWAGYAPQSQYPPPGGPPADPNNPYHPPRV